MCGCLYMRLERSFRERCCAMEVLIISPTSEVNMGYYFRRCEPLDPDLEESNSSTWHSICLRYIRMLCLAVKVKAIQKTHLSRTRTIAEGSPTLTTVHMP